jgi:hypothetical protein
MGVLGQAGSRQRLVVVHVVQQWPEPREQLRHNTH